MKIPPGQKPDGTMMNDSERWKPYIKIDWILGAMGGLVGWALLAFVSPWH